MVVSTHTLTHTHTHTHTQTDRQTHTQDNYRNPPAHARRGLIMFFRLHIYVISKWLLTQLTHALTITAIARVSPYVHSTCTSYVLNAYLYCVYALVGGAISIRDPYICAVSRVCANESHAVFHRPVVCAVKT